MELMLGAPPPKLNLLPRCRSLMENISLAAGTRRAATLGVKPDDLVPGNWRSGFPLGGAARKEDG